MPRSLFDDLDDAARVYVATSPAQMSPTVRLRVEDTLKGVRATHVDFVSGLNDMPSPNQRHLVVLDAQGQALGPCSLRVLRGRTGRRLAGAARSYLGQRNRDRRVRQLFRLATSPDVALAEPAARRLAADPQYASRLDPLQIQRLVGVLRRTTDARTSHLAALMGRLHVLDAVPWLVERMGDAGQNARPMIDALELLTNHLTPNYRRGHDVHGAQLAAIQTHWRDWYATNQNHADFVARGYQERSLTPPTSRAEHQNNVQRGPDRVTRSVSLAACENRRAPADELSITVYLLSPLSESQWSELSQRCR